MAPRQPAKPSRKPGKPSKKVPPLPVYSVEWNPDRARYDVTVAGRSVGFHRLRGGAEAIGEREAAKLNR